MASPKGLARIDVESRILAIRGENVILDSDLAVAYGVTTKVLNQAVKRNEARFPDDFRFQLNDEEIANLKSQSVTSSSAHGGRRKLPWAYTEHGAIMAATVLNSSQAVEMSVFVVRAFIRLRQFARGHAEISKRLDALEKSVAGHDDALKQMFAALRSLLAQPENAHGESDSNRSRTNREAAASRSRFERGTKVSSLTILLKISPAYRLQ